MKKRTSNFDAPELVHPIGPGPGVTYEEWMSIGQSSGSQPLTWYQHIFGLRPQFILEYVPFMLLDGRVSLAMQVIKGKIATTNLIRVRTDNADVEEYVTKYFERIWQSTILDDLLSFLDFGYAAVEFECEWDGGLFYPTDSQAYNPYYVRPAIDPANRFVGFFPKPGNDEFYIGFPRGVWLTHNKRKDPIFGDSHLRPAFDPFWEKWNKHGFQEGRRVWFQRCAFFGPVLKFPPTGTVQIDAQGNTMSAMQYASLILQRLYTGASIAFPNEKDENGKDLWELIAAVSNDVPTSHKEYGESLRVEIFEGLGVIPGILEATANTFQEGDTTSIMLEAFLSMLTGIYKELATGVNTSALQAAVRKQFGRDVRYSLYIEEWKNVAPPPNKAQAPGMDQPQPDDALPLDDQNQNILDTPNEDESLAA